MDSGTIARLVVVVIALVNTVCTLIGWNPLPISEEAAYAGVSAIFTIVTTAWAWWKNNSVTVPAITADKVLCAIKSGVLDITEVLAILPKDKE